MNQYVVNWSEHKKNKYKRNDVRVKTQDQTWLNYVNPLVNICSRSYANIVIVKMKFLLIYRNIYLYI